MVNRFDMIIFTTSSSLFVGSSCGRNEEVKRAGAGVVLGWVTGWKV